MKQIIAIGGGEFTDYITELKIESYLLKQCKSFKPKVCFLPQASGEDSKTIVSFMDTFKKLGADPSWFSLFGRTQDNSEQMILNQDMIYVGGGNTRSMLALWREWGLEKVLRKAYESGVILCGSSAGGICWYQQFITDSMLPLGVMEGLGMIKGSCCPHYSDEPGRKQTFKDKIIKKKIIPGIALDSGTAAHYIDGELKHVVSTSSNKNAYMVANKEEKIISVIL
jgi:peptidase E